MKKVKHIRINTPDGVYAVKLETIAFDRAYRLMIFGYSKFINYLPDIMNDNFEGIRWLMMQMTFEDIEDKAFKINNEIFVAADDFWTNYDDFEIIEIEVD